MGWDVGMKLADRIGIGVDIEDISRFRKLPFNRNKRFYTRIFHEDEIKYSLAKADPYQHFTARYCAKEAFIKAVSWRIDDYREIQVRLVGKKPFIYWKGKRHLLSLAHEGDKAIAFVVVVDDGC